MILDTTTRKLEILLGGAVTTNQLPVTTAWWDMTTTATTPGNTPVNTNGATAVTIVAAPAASTQRKITHINVFNADTASATVTIRLNDNGTTYNKVSFALPVGYTLEYDGVGWKVLNTTGTLLAGVQGPQGPQGAGGAAGATGAGMASLGGINDQTGTTYTFVLGDAGQMVRGNNASAQTYTVPPHSSVAWPIGTLIMIEQKGAGAITLSPGAGVTLNAANGLATIAQYDTRGLINTDTDVWTVV